MSQLWPGLLPSLPTCPHVSNWVGCSREACLADSTSIIDTLATGGATKTVTDDGSGSDWLELDGGYAATSTITLAWTAVSGTATQASGLCNDGTDTSRLIVNGTIENLRGSNGKDAITGNELGKHPLWRSGRDRHRQQRHPGRGGWQ